MPHFRDLTEKLRRVNDSNHIAYSNVFVLLYSITEDLNKRLIVAAELDRAVLTWRMS